MRIGCARIFYSIAFFIYKFLFLRRADVRSNFIRPGVKIGKGVVIERGVQIFGSVLIGDYTFINELARIEPNTQSIGKYCSISHSVKIGLGPHPLGRFSTSAVFYSPGRGIVSTDSYNEFEDKGFSKVGNDVLIGAGAVVMAGVCIGDGAVVAAGSVVTKNVPPYAIVAGNPAKIIRFRFDDVTISRLLDSQWWNIPISKLRVYAEMQLSVQSFLDLVEGGK